MIENKQLFLFSINHCNYRTNPDIMITITYLYFSDNDKKV